MQLFFFKISLLKNKPVDFTSITNFELEYFSDKYSASINPILSENISLPSLSTTPRRSPSPSKANPTSALLSLTFFERSLSIVRSSGLGL